MGTNSKKAIRIAALMIFTISWFAMIACEKPVKGDWRGKIYWANLTDNKIYQANPDGSNVIAFAKTGTWPDSVVVDEKSELMYWTNMGDVEGTSLNGTIQMCQMDNCYDSTVTIVDKGNTATPKQLSLDRVNGYIYWADRDRELIQRCRLDGSNVETVLVLKDKSKIAPVGCEIDGQDNILYWSEKDTNRIGRIELGKIELSYNPQEKDYIVLSGLNGPTEIKVDKIRQKIFIAERSANRISSVPTNGGSPTAILETELSNPVGLALDRENGVIFISELYAEDINKVNMDGTNFKIICSSRAKYNTGMFFVPSI